MADTVDRASGSAVFFVRGNQKDFARIKLHIRSEDRLEAKFFVQPIDFLGSWLAGCSGPCTLFGQKQPAKLQVKPVKSRKKKNNLPT
ncbi:MAG: hypothetical protein Q8M84_11450 [Thiobacillus sp.]|nr:hypothetical protein [Gammaproteobacteria bacterium]MDP3126238.1 hypothetical protein [Thiobacillus sp.]